ncbi:MAG: hypothetical protein ABIF09_12895 [Gemmatimonadota bacterium]
MRRRYRLALSVLVALGSVALVITLVAAGTASEGPISSVFRRVGGWVSGLESRAVHSLRGPGRTAGLGWLAPHRADADSLRHPDDLLLGVYTENLTSTLEGVTALEETLDVTFPLIQHYTAWGEEPSQLFPGRIVQAIDALGSIPVITWEPWLTTFENRNHPHLPLRESRDRGGLVAVAAGDYDFYLEPWAWEAAEWGKPLLVRVAHEMNDPYRYPWGPQNNQPWVATGALNYGTVAYWSQWWSFDEIFGRHHEFLLGLGKPIMIAEFGTLGRGIRPTGT